MLKYIFVILMSFVIPMTAFAGAAKAVTSDVKVNPYGKFFSGDGLQVELALIEGKNSSGLQDALIRISGSAAHTAGIDGKVIRYIAVPAGTGFDYTFMKDGVSHNRMASRSPWGDWSVFEVYFGNKTYHIYPDDKKAKDVKTSELLKEFKSNK